MAQTYRRGTIVKRMLETSGVSAEEVSAAIGKDRDYVSRVANGKEPRVPTNTINLIAKRCGYEVAFVGHGETLVLAAVDRPIELRELTFEGDLPEAGENEFTGKQIAVTGALYGYTSEAQQALFEAVGAKWTEEAKTKTTNILIIGSDIDEGRITGQMRRVMGAKRGITEMMRAEEFRKRYLEITGFDIASPTK